MDTEEFENGSTASAFRGEVVTLLDSPSLVAGAFFIIMSAIMATTGPLGVPVVVAFIGYVVAGALASPRPFVTGTLLALLHGLTVLAFDQLVWGINIIGGTQQDWWAAGLYGALVFWC